MWQLQVIVARNNAHKIHLPNIMNFLVRLDDVIVVIKCTRMMIIINDPI